MMLNLSIYINVLFVLTTVFALVLIVRTIYASPVRIDRKIGHIISTCLIVWLLLQAILSFRGVYNTDTSFLPPKLVLFGVLPFILLFLLLFLTKTGQRFIDGLSLKKLTFIHVVRIPVELLLYLLYIEKAVPELMTFTGRNFDILAGLTAPIVAHLSFTKKQLSTRSLLLWNFICLGLLINIVVNALLAAPTPLQQFAFNQPNIAVLYFPFSWLPSFIVPIVLFSHLVSIRQLLKTKTISL